MDDIKFFTELTRMLDNAKGNLTGEEAFQAEMDVLDRLEQELDLLDDLRNENEQD